MPAVDEATAQSLLESLVDAALLESPGPGRHRYHDLVRVFAARRSGKSDNDIINEVPRTARQP